MATYEWETDVNGYVGTLQIELGSAPYNPAQNSGWLQLDGFPREKLADVRMVDSTLYFTRPQAGQKFNGIFHTDRVLGTFSDGSGLEYPWSAQPGVANNGLAELGDWNGDGTADIRDVVDYLTSLGLQFHTYRVCDDEYNPGGFNLLDHPPAGLDITSESWTWRPDGLVKVIAPEKFDQYAVTTTPYPVAKIANLRFLAKAALSIPRPVLDSLLVGQSWKVDFSGIMGQDGITAEWLVNVNNYRGRLLIASLQTGSGRVRFDGVPPLHWEAIYSVEQSGSGEIHFHRVLSNGIEQAYTGNVSGPNSSGKYTISGTFTQEGQSYSWGGEGKWYEAGAGISEFSIQANGKKGHLLLRLPSGWIGRMILAQDPNVDLDPWTNPERWETLEQIDFQNNTLHFSRPGAQQEFTGTVSGNHIAGTFKPLSGGSQSYSWDGNRVYATGGTTAPGFGNRPDREIGNVGRLMYLGTHSTPPECFEEVIAHPLRYWISAGNLPFTADDVQAFNAAGFQAELEAWVYAPDGRPIGFVSDYASKGDEDFANTFVAYVVHRPALWSLVWQDQIDHNSTVLGDKMRFIQQHIFHDAYVGGPWRINANKHQGILTLNLVAGSPPTFTGSVHFESSAQSEPIDKIAYNGVNLSFHRREPGGSDQNFIGKLKHWTIEGFFTQNGQSYPWSAISVIQV